MLPQATRSVVIAVRLRRGFKVDRFHAPGHKCSPAIRQCSPVAFNNTSVAEQFINVLRRIEPSLRSMKPLNAMQLLRIFVVHHNWMVNSQARVKASAGCGGEHAGEGETTGCARAGAGGGDGE